jgi:hypothetical protein
LSVGDNILLIDTSDSITPKFVSKEISNIETFTEFFGGYEISVANSHLFLTKDSNQESTSYVSIEHNIGNPCNVGNCEYTDDCNKGEYCCNFTCVNVGNCFCGFEEV